jgi:DNA-binding MarR family transcriptional regulator
VHGRHGAGAAADAVYDLLASFIRLNPRDMSLTSLSALATLDRTGPRRITELAASEGVTQPSVTSLVASLVRAGYVERRSDPADKRVVVIAITEAGSTYLGARRAVTAGVFADAVEELSAEEGAILAAAVPVIERLRDLVEGQRGVARDRK